MVSWNELELWKELDCFESEQNPTQIGKNTRVRGGNTQKGRETKNEYEENEFRSEVQ